MRTAAVLLLLLALAKCDILHKSAAEEPLALDAAKPGEEGVRRLRLGEKVALDELGPVIVNSDCTLRRIENWAQKLPHEQADIQRGIAARNAVRLARCRELEAAGELEGHGELR